MQRMLIPIVVLFAVGAAAQGQPAWRFHWDKGQAVTYRVEHISTATDIAAGQTNGFSSKLVLTKRWLVKDVETDGIATVEMSMTAMRYEITPPDGKTVVFDSADPEHSDPALKEEMSRYVGSVLAVLRIDAIGQVVEVKESKHGPASKFESDLPFKLVLPAAAATEGASWERKYKITLEPPLGTGEKYDAKQTYTCKAIKDGTVTVGFTTTVLNPPQSIADQRPLLPMQTAGDVVFDMTAGIMRSARVQIDKELKNHQGEGSSYRLQSTYTEQYVGEK